MLDGGVIARRPYLIVGPSGSGKSTLALQFLCEGVRRGERGLLVTLEEPPNEARLNHRGLGPEFDRVEVFDAIPDVMRYERVPFKDISAVRASMPFGQVPFVIRRTPELTGVEVTITALEQMLRAEVTRRGFTRVVIDSLTALQYFCMKGFNEVAGAQTFLRFLSDLQVTTFLTVESPIEDADTTERMLARGEIRLFRWELENATVRAIGVEKFRGSSHDIRLHPYRIGPQGIDINLSVTISRDTRQIIEAQPAAGAAALPTSKYAGGTMDPLLEQVRDLVLIEADVGPIRAEIEAALAGVRQGEVAEVPGHVARASALAMDVAGAYRNIPPPDASKRTPEASAALMRVVARASEARAGFAPTQLPPSAELQRQLEMLLTVLPTGAGIVAPGTEPLSPVAPEAPETPASAPPPPTVAPIAPVVSGTPSAPTGGGRRGVPRAVTPVPAPVPPPPEPAPPTSTGSEIPAPEPAGAPESAPPPAPPPAPAPAPPPSPPAVVAPEAPAPVPPAPAVATPPPPPEPEPMPAGPAAVPTPEEALPPAAAPAPVEVPVASAPMPEPAPPVAEPADVPRVVTAPIAPRPPVEPVESSSTPPPSAAPSPVPLVPVAEPSASVPTSVAPEPAVAAPAPASASGLTAEPVSRPLPPRPAAPPTGAVATPRAVPPSRAAPSPRRTAPPEPPALPSGLTRSSGSPGKASAGGVPPATAAPAGIRDLAAKGSAPARDPSAPPPLPTRTPGVVPTPPPAASPRERPAVPVPPPTESVPPTPPAPSPASEPAPAARETITPPALPTTAPPAAPAKRRAKRAPKVPRKVEPRAATESPASEPTGVSAPAGGVETPVSEGTVPPAPPKPRKRAVRKKKAPSVISATEGTSPPDVQGQGEAPPPPSEDAPEKPAE